MTEKTFYMDGYLKQNLELLKDTIKKDWDMIFVVDGYEGSGKSVLAQQVSYFCDNSFNIDRIVFNPDDFKQVIMASEPYQAVIYDEAYGGLSSKSALSKVNKTIVQMLTVIRQRNLFVFIVLPTFFDLDKYVALWRSRGLLHVYTSKNMARGYFEFYNAGRKKDMYVKGKKFYEYRQGKCNFRGRFSKFWVVDKDAYDKKKLKQSISLDDNETHHVTKMKNIYQTIAQNLMIKFPTIRKKEIAELLDLHPQTIGRYELLVNSKQ
jgi:hypothetical protein